MSSQLEIGILIYMTIIGTIIMLLLFKSRFSRTIAVFSVCVLLAVLVAAVAIGSRILGTDNMVRYYSAVIHLPSLLFFAVLSCCRGWRLVFQLLSAIFFCALIHHFAALIYFLAGRHTWVLVLSYGVVSALIICFLIFYLRPLFFQILSQLDKCWAVMNLMLVTYYGTVIYLIPGYAGDDVVSTFLKPAISLLMMGFYSVILLLLSSVQQESQTRYNTQVLTLSLASLQSRMDAVQASEALILKERDSLCRQLEAAAALAAGKDFQKALDFLGNAQLQMDQHADSRWCRPPIINAVFSSYSLQAQYQKIRIDAHIALSDPLPMEESELAIVFANALENAVHACSKLPQEQRVIRCRAISRPRLMFRISNPCPGPILFDQEGLPVSSREGHGLGSQSIASFCKKYRALYHYELKDGWFSLQVTL